MTGIIVIIITRVVNVRVSGRTVAEETETRDISSIVLTPKVTGTTGGVVPEEIGPSP